MAQAAKINLRVNQRATFRKRVTWKDSRKKPINLTGYTGRLQVRTSATDNTVLLELTTSNGGITITPLLGQIDILITDEQTAALTFKTAVYDLLLDVPDGSKVRLIEGSMTVIPGVTVAA